MKIRVYNKAYLNGAMTVRTTMLDYAVNICHGNVKDYAQNQLAVSGE